MSPAVTLCSGPLRNALSRLLAPYGLRVRKVAQWAPIPGSYWGPPEAGLIGDELTLRPDTPVHSVLHEASHFICMDGHRREALDTDAGGEVPEENAVCYLQALLADRLPGYNRQHLFADMDAWGYSFRLGSAAAWFRNDADDARDWLLQHELIDTLERPTGRCRS